MALQQPQSIRVFVSSTFIDLFREREYLVKRIFPEIRHFCRERGIGFTEIDLRWGLTYEDSSFGRVISTCLQEIDRCRPFFIGMLGERYGWIPDLSDIHKNAHLVEDQPWLEEAVLDGSSLVEMEFNYGVLNSERAMPGAFFYLREAEEDGDDGHSSDGADEPTPELAREKLRGLRKRIRASGKPVRNFQSLEELGTQVRLDLLQAISALYPQDEEDTPLEHERRMHEAFAITRRQAYVPKQELLQRLTKHVDSLDQPLILFGESGLGKSALLAYWSRFYAQRHPETRVVTHFVGSVSNDDGHEGLLRRMLSEIRDLLGDEEPVPDSKSEMERVLPAWIARVPEKKLVLVIDALNELDSRAATLSWLPRHFPSNVRVIFSSTPGVTLDALRDRGWPEYELQHLEGSEREALITRFLSEFHKSLTTPQRQRIAHDAISDNPLFLRTLLEELRLFGNFEKVDDRINYYLEARDMGDLFQRVLERIELDFGAGVVRNVMSAVWASRQGLTESELLSLTGLTRAEGSQLLIALEYHLVQRQGLLRFFHDHLRQAVERKYLPTEADRRAAHAALANFYLNEPSSERRAAELPVQLSGAEMLKELHIWLTDIPEFLLYCTEDEQWRFVGYWLRLKDHHDRGASYEYALGRYRKAVSQLDYAKALGQIGRFMISSGEYTTAEKMMKEALPIIEGEYGPNAPETAVALTDLGKMLQSRGLYAEAEPHLKRALEINESTFGPSHQLIARSLTALGTLCYYRGDYSGAERLLRRAFMMSSELLGSSHPLTLENQSNLGVMLYSIKEYQGAITIFEETLDPVKRTFGEMHPEYAGRLLNLSVVKAAIGSFDDASRLIKESMRIMEALLGPDHPDTIRSIHNLGTIEREAGDLPAAELHLRLAVKRSVRLYGEQHPEVAIALIALGAILQDQGELEDAEQVLEKALAILINSLGDESEQTAACKLRLASIAVKHREFARARELFGASIEMQFDLRVKGQRRRHVELIDCCEEYLDLTDPSEDQLRSKLKHMIETLRAEERAANNQNSGSAITT